jgi:hypothetical protein
MLHRLTFAALVVVSCALADLRADHDVPFKGTWTGVTVSADLSGFPVVQIVAEGEGELTHLGHSTMVSPHTTHVFTGETVGDQIFTAANGDTLTAFCAGFPQFQPDMTVVGALDCTVTSGTGRFAEVTGSYEFFLVATPLPDRPGFSTVATITGSMSSIGSSK